MPTPDLVAEICVGMETMKRKLYSLLFILSSFVSSMYGETIKQGGLTFVTGADTAYVKSYSTIPDDGKLTIPSEITSSEKTYKVTAVKNSAFMTCTEIKELTIGKGVKYIEGLAFKDCLSLTKVTLEQGDDVLFVGTDAFQNCPVAEIAIGRNLTTISLTAYTTSLKKVILSSNITRITSFLFYDSSIEEINLSNVTDIESSSFYSCKNLLDVDIQKVLRIGQSAFSNSGLKKVKIPSCTEEILNHAFNNCDNLESLEICGNPKIESKSFSNCSNLENIVLSDKISEIPEIFDNCQKLKSIDLSNITFIGNSAFENCSSLEEVKFGKIQEIGFDAFRNTNLKEISFGESLTKLGSSCFEDCANLRTVDLSRSKVSSIPFSAFERCKSLDNAKFPDCLKNIVSYSFSSCKSLKTIDLSNTNVTSIYIGCFNDCTALTEVTLSASTDTIGSDVFSGCSSLSKINNLDNIVYVGHNAFTNTLLFSSVTKGEIFVGKVLYQYVGVFEGDNYVINDGITSVTGEALRGQNFKMLTIGKDVNSIGNDAFSDCKSLIALTIPTNVTNFGKLSGCDNLANITIKSSKEVLKSNSIDCPSLKKMYYGRMINVEGNNNLPALNNLTVGEYVTNLSPLSSCTNITNLDLEDSDLEIDLIAIDRSKVVDLYMGRNIKSYTDYQEDRNRFNLLASLTIGEKVTFIPNYFMKNSEGVDKTHTLKEIVIPSNVKKIGNEAFSLYSNTIEKIVLNEGLEEVGQHAFGFCSKKNIGEFRIPSTVKKIGMLGFAGLICDKLIIPEGVGELGTNAFYQTVTDELILPSTIKLAHESFAFSEFKFIDASKVVCKRTNSSFIYNKKLEKFIFPETLEEIDENEFWYCNNLDGIVIPSTVKKIGSNSFVGIKQRRFVIPATVEVMGRQAFEDRENKAVLEFEGTQDAVELVCPDYFENVRIIKADRNISINPDYSNGENISTCFGCDTLVIGSNCNYIKNSKVDVMTYDIPVVYNLSRNLKISKFDNNVTTAYFVLPESKDIALGGKEIVHVNKKTYDLSEGEIKLDYINNTSYSISPIFFKEGVDSELTAVGEYELGLKIEGSTFDGIYPTNVIITITDISTGINEISDCEEDYNLYNLSGERDGKNYKGIVVRMNGKKEAKVIVNK